MIVKLEKHWQGSVSSEMRVAQRAANSAGDNDNLSSDAFVKLLLGIEDKYSVLAILSLGISDDNPSPHSADKADFSKAHEGNWSYREVI